IGDKKGEKVAKINGFDAVKMIFKQLLCKNRNKTACSVAYVINTLKYKKNIGSKRNKYLK
ncbi:MAG: hypothetical protein MK212_20520, partial [Saprospiraceae bacterium]|nr:hypothetical protein [Saprospiraceae bacterium]